MRAGVLYGVEGDLNTETLCLNLEAPRGAWGSFNRLSVALVAFHTYTRVGLKSQL